MVPHIWSGAAHLDSPSTPISPEIDTFRYWVLGSPAPAPRLFAIGLDYRAYALEAGFAIPEDPPVFTKYVFEHHRPDHRGGSAAGRPHRLGGRAGRRESPLRCGRPRRARWSPRPATVPTRERVRASASAVPLIHSALRRDNMTTLVSCPTAFCTG